MMEITKDYKKVIQMDGVFFVKEYMEELDKLGLYNFDSIMNCKCGELIKDTGTRKVFRIRSSDGRIRFYLKTHRCKWGLFGFLYKDRGDGGFREWENIFNLMHAGIPTQSPVSAGLRRKGSSVESFIITENLEGYKRMEIYMVENFAVSFSQRDIRKKREIIKKTASLIRMMHDSGFCHGDLYLTHIMIKDDGNNLDLRFIDLQRLRKRTIRNIVKDLASLNFAAKSSYTTPSDRLRFIKHYLGKDRLDKNAKYLIRKIIKKSEKIAKHDVNVTVRRSKDTKTLVLPPANISKIIFIENVNIGDLINATPAIKAVKDRFPYARVDVLISDNLSEIIKAIPLFDKIFSYSKYSSGKHKNKIEHIMKLWDLFFNYIRKEKYDIAIALRSGSSPSTALKTYLSGAKYRIGGVTGDWRRKRCWMDWLWTKGIKPFPINKHEVERCFDIVEAIGVDRTKCEKKLILNLPKEYMAEARNNIKSIGLNENDFIHIHITSRHPKNRWKEDRFIELCKRIREKFDKLCIITFGPHDRSKAEKIHTECGDDICKLYPTPDVLRLCGIISISPLFITTEGGPMHMSAALGVKTIAIFGKSPVEVWRPWGEGHIVIKRGDTAESVSVDDVIEAINNVIEVNNI